MVISESMSSSYRLGEHPKQHRLAILHHQNRGLKKLDLVADQIERRGRNRHNKGQSTASPNQHTNCKDLERIFRSGKTSSHLAIVGTETDVVEVEKGRRDLIPKHHRHHHLIEMSLENQTLKKLNRCKKRMGPHSQRRGTEGAAVGGPGGSG